MTTLKEAKIHMFPLSQFICNIILCSIPEESYAICLCLVLLGMANEIRLNKKLVLSIFLPAIISNALRYFINTSVLVTFTLFVFVMSITILSIYRQYTLKRMFLVFVCTVTACVSNMILEILNYGILMMCTPLTEIILKDNIYYAFISSLPFRVVELLFVVLYIKHKKFFEYKARVNLWQQLIRNKDQMYFAVVVSIFNILWVVGSVKLFIIDNILLKSNIRLAPSLFLLTGDILLPVVIFTSLLFSIYCTRARDIYIKSSNRDLLISKVNIAKYYSNKNNYIKVKEILDEVVEDFIKGGESY